jgi:hypothetical protein
VGPTMVPIWKTEDGRVPRHGAGELMGRDEVGHERLARRPGEGARGAQQHQDRVERPQLGDTRP